MRAFFKGAIVAASSALILACGGSGPFDKALDHGEKIASVIEANKGDADKAADAVEKYIADNKADLDAMKAAMEKEMGEMMAEAMKAGDNPEALADMRKKYASKMESFEKRGKALEARIEKLKAENPALKDNARIDAAMAGLFGSMKM